MVKRNTTIEQKEYILSKPILYLFALWPLCVCGTGVDSAGVINFLVFTF